MAYLPVTIEDMKKRGWSQADFVYVIGDAYVDHSSLDQLLLVDCLSLMATKL